MTKLEEKLIELGYKPSSRYKRNRYSKSVNDFKLELVFLLQNNNSNIDKYYLIPKYPIFTQQDIDNLQQPLNQLQNDSDVLKNVKD